MSQERLGKSRRRAGSTEADSFSNDPLFSDGLIFQEEAILPSEDSELVRQGRSAAWRSGVSGETQADFLSEYLMGCWLSPDRSNLALTCTCGANRARSFLRQERRWQARVGLTESTEVASLLPERASLAPESSVTIESPVSPEGHLLAQEFEHRLLAAICQLTPMQQRVWCLRHHHCLSFAQIASQTGQSIVATRVMARIAQRRLFSVLVIGGMTCGEACEYLSLLDRSAAVAKCFSALSNLPSLI